MRIDEVLTQTIVGVYSATSTAHTLYLKGGSAMRLFDNLTSRISIDADFSIVRGITDENKFFNSIKSAVGSQFRKSKYDILDFQWVRRPKKKKQTAQTGGVDGYVSLSLSHFGTAAKI